MRKVSNYFFSDELGVVSKICLEINVLKGVDISSGVSLETFPNGKKTAPVTYLISRRRNNLILVLDTSFKRAVRLTTIECGGEVFTWMS
jgi:hypothetical protein